MPHAPQRSLTTIPPLPPPHITNTKSTQHSLAKLGASTVARETFSWFTQLEGQEFDFNKACYGHKLGSAPKKSV